MDVESNNHPITIGYYPIRLKGQVSRLICQYLSISYEDKFFDPHSWKQYKQKQAKNWIFRDLPFLKDEDFVVTGSLGIATYLTEKAGRVDLFGRTIQDKIKIDNLIKKCDILMMIHASNWCSLQYNQIARKKCLQVQWEKKIKPLVMLYEQECQLSPWFFSYVTVIDFSVYQIVNQIEVIYPTKIIAFNKLQKLREKVSKINQIESYQKSGKCVKQLCPISFFKEFKEQKINSYSEMNSTTSQNSKKSMD